MIDSGEFLSRSSSQPRRLSPDQRGQGLVEFGLIASVLILLVLGGIQLAMVLNAALAVSEYSYAAARYTAVHGTGQDAGKYGATLLPTPPTGCPASTSPAPVTPPATIYNAGLQAPAVSSSDPSGKITSGAQVTVSVTYNLGSGCKIALPNPFFGVTFPTSITNSTSVMAE